jgi:predicted TIM-barrel fold metal-dependent hydrolase
MTNTQTSSGGGRIDVHAHIIPPALRAALADTSRFPMPVRVPAWTPEIAVELMDRNGIAAQLVSISVPGTHHGDDKSARELSRACNDYAADCVARFPERFGAYAVLPLPDVDGAIAEIDYALDVLKLDGIGLFTSYDGKHLGHADLDPVLAALDSHGATVFVHPTAHQSIADIDLGVPPFMIEYTFDTTRAAMNLVLSTAMDRFPNINFILSHAGGTLPFLAWRISELGARIVASKELRAKYPVPLFEKLGQDVKPEMVMERIRRFWLDTANAAGAATFGAIEHAADPGRILFGTDWPYVPESVVQVSNRDVDAALTDYVQREAVDRGNALALFPRLA